MSRRIAFFDFDGTITTSDTLLENIRFQKGFWPFVVGFALASPWIVAFKLKIISNQSAKERVLKWFFGGTPIIEFQKRCDDFAKEALPSLIREGAEQEFMKLKELNTEIVIVSASAGNWLRKWTEAKGFALIATSLQVNDNIVTGKISGKNCHGEEKVRRIKAEYKLEQYDEVYCYGDSKGDRPMLALGKFQYYKPFR